MLQPRQSVASVPTYPAGAPHITGRARDGSRIGAHRHAEGQLLYCASGALATTTAYGTWIAPANRVTWTPPGFQHAHRCHGDTDVRIVVLPAELCARLPRHPSVCTVGPLLREAILALTDRRETRPEVYARLRAVLVDELVETPEQSLHLPEPRDDRLRAVTELLHEDPAQMTTLAEFGRAVGASERTLTRLFHRELGMSFLKWRTMLRIHRALVHLAGGRSVTDTSIACGWSNPTSFIEAFTTLTGQTPGRYQAGIRAPQDSRD